jgi:hypothetical protein
MPQARDFLGHFRQSTNKLLILTKELDDAVNLS